MGACSHPDYAEPHPIFVKQIYSKVSAIGNVETHIRVSSMKRSTVVSCCGKGQGFIPWWGRKYATLHFGRMQGATASHPIARGVVPCRHGIRPRRGKHKAQARQLPVTMKHRQNKGYATWHLRAIRHHILSDVPFMESSHNVNKFIRESLQHFLLDVWRHLSVECLCYPASYRPHRVSVAVQ